MSTGGLHYSTRYEIQYNSGQGSGGSHREMTQTRSNSSGASSLSSTLPSNRQDIDSSKVAFPGNDNSLIVLEEINILFTIYHNLVNIPDNILCFRWHKTQMSNGVQM